MTALLKVEQISAPKGAQMPLFDHEGVEYGELSDSGPPRLSAAAGPTFRWRRWGNVAPHAVYPPGAL